MKLIWTITACGFLWGSGGFAANPPAATAFPSAEQLLNRREDGVQRIPLLPPGPGNPRNSEGDFIALKDGRILFVYTHFTGGTGDEATAHLASRESKDGGDTWKPLAPSDILSPCSPASLERIPKTGDLLMVWNNHRSIPASLKGKRTPLSVAISRDDGRTWEKTRPLEDHAEGWYCYTAIEFTGDHVLLGHCAGLTSLINGLAHTQITRFGLGWLYR